MAKKPIKRIFIANRGEIARRIATTARRMGIEAVAVTDRSVPPEYLSHAISHFAVVPEESTALYLDAEKMIALAKDSKADAIHPGFGFLSENAGFAEAVERAGLVWIGPNPKSIHAMASKAAARDAATQAGVPCVPGLAGFPVPENESGDFSALEAFAKKVGYPLLIKAALGGGGKGMRVVTGDKSLRESAVRARSEAVNSFGDAALICERYLACPRHVEVQILADKHGNVVVLGDRDCSIQRRHQKVIEEAPAPFIPESTRAAIHAAAKSLASKVKYDSTGTVEFLLDWSDEAKASPSPAFYFLEMNTRLQVEHTVTEEVFGLDLVEWQIRVASGDELPKHFSALKPQGHAFEARLYAEDVINGYLPSPGPVSAFLPEHGPGVRWEIGLDARDEITGRFDPMIAKLITYGESRHAAAARMVQCLRSTTFAGPPNNLGLIVYLLSQSAFNETAVGTPFLETERTPIEDWLKTQAAHLADTFEPRLAQLKERVSANADGVSHHAITTNAFSTSATLSDVKDDLKPLARQTLRSSSIPGATEVARFYEPDIGTYTFVSDDRSDVSMQYIIAQGFGLRRVAEVGRRGNTAKRSGSLASLVPVAPVPGKVITIKVKPGDKIEEGDSLIVLESMKMEFEVKSPRSGVIGEVLVKSQDQVNAGQTIALWREEEKS